MATKKQPWRPRAYRACTPGLRFPNHNHEAYELGGQIKTDDPVRIIPEADYQRLLELAGLKEGVEK